MHHVHGLHRLFWGGFCEKLFKNALAKVENAGLLWMWANKRVFVNAAMLHGCEMDSGSQSGLACVHSDSHLLMASIALKNRLYMYLNTAQMPCVDA